MRVAFEGTGISSKFFDLPDNATGADLIRVSGLAAGYTFDYDGQLFTPEQFAGVQLADRSFVFAAQKFTNG